jgi:D-alanyl-D-alanine carboxypeptidase/D-alanyl-D-alanine-endopeptidase (penicillin-binding protein 4)
MKIITSAAALLTMGPTFRFTTRVESARDAVVSPDGTLAGPAYLIGAGDPMLATRAFSRNFLDNTGTQIERLAVNIRQSGIRTISGGIVVDESLFDARRTGPQWEGSYVWECGPLSAAATNQGRAGNSEGVKVHGAIRSGPDVPGGTVVGQVRSRPISAILGFMNPASNNFSAEMLTKDVGAYGSGHGTTAAGTARAAAILRDQGAFVPGDHLVDGSGLSHANRLSAWTLVTTLAQANANPRWGDALVQSLEHGGEGTLRRRLRDPAVGPRVRAKTGYISGVASLAGIVTSPAGATYAFAFLINDPNISLAQRTMDRAVTLLATGAADGAQAINR